MSGIEVVGLVLGGLPLLISACEHYRDGLDPIKDFLRYDSTLKSLRTRLAIQQELFEGTLQVLLLDQLSEAESKIMFPEVRRPEDISPWFNNDIDGKLQGRLGDKYSMFMDVVKDMDSIMRRLMDKLEVDIQSKVGTSTLFKTL